MNSGHSPKRVSSPRRRRRRETHCAENTWSGSAHPSAERKINKRRITAPYILPEPGKYGAVLYMSAWKMLSLLSFRADCKTLCPSEVTTVLKRMCAWTKMPTVGYARNRIQQRPDDAVCQGNGRARAMEGFFTRFAGTA